MRFSGIAAAAPLALLFASALLAEQTNSLQAAQGAPEVKKALPALAAAGTEALEALPLAEKEDPAIQKDLEELTARIREVRTFTADFAQKDIDPLFMDESESSGRLAFRRAVKEARTNCLLRFDYEKPEPSVTIMTPRYVAVHTSDMVAPQVSQVAGDNDADVLFSTFVTPLQLKRHYILNRLPAGEGECAFKLIPQSAFVRRFFKEAEVTFDRTTGLPKRVRQLKLNGQDITLSFSGVQLNPELPADYFDASALGRKGE